MCGGGQGLAMFREDGGGDWGMGGKTNVGFTTGKMIQQTISSPLMTKRGTKVVRNRLRTHALGECGSGPEDFRP